MKRLALALSLLLAGCRSWSGGLQPAGALKGAAPQDSWLAALKKLDSNALWPKFDVRATPIAYFDGTKTWFYDRDEVSVLSEGRHPAVTANSATKIDDVMTATLMPMRDSLPLREKVGLAVHELFHAHQQKNHPTWAANEADLFIYPLDDARNLALARLEVEALRRALHAQGDASACWAASAMALRRERFTHIPASAATYEGSTEMNEGLPTYVQHRVDQLPDARVLPATFDAASVRQRAYATGHAIARLLDRHSPTWRELLEAGDARPLDQLLTAAVADVKPACTFSDAERTTAQQLAERDAATLRATRTQKRDAFLAQRGWRLVITMKTGVLWPQRFDPLNVTVAAPGEILHTRHVKLGNESSSIEILGHPALTTAAGAHPLFNGVKTLTITGLATKPEVGEGEVVTIKGDGVEARLRAADMDVRLTQEQG